MRDITTRRINPRIPTLTITFVSLVATTLSSLLLAIVAEESWRQPEAEYVGFIGAAAVVLSVGSVLGVKAFRNVDVSVVAPFRYSLLIWGALSGYFVFGEVSDLQSVCGSILIVGSGLYTLHRERVRHRMVAAKVEIQ
jgi:drug/metabolite transporter (DMT)-like permease